MHRFGMEVMWIYTSTQIRCMSSMLVPSRELVATAVSAVSSRACH